MKKVKNILMIVTAFLVMLIGCMAMAETKEADLYYNDKQQDLVITVAYEKDDVTIQIVDPTGKTIATADSNVEMIKTEKSVMYLVTGAAEGQWKIVYDKGTNESISYNVYNPGEPITITDFSVDNITDSSVDVSFATKCDKEVGYNYTIYLGIDPNMSKTVTLDSGYATSGEKLTKTISFENISSYDSYYISVYVEYKDGSTTTFDKVVSDKFAYNNSKKADAFSDYYVEVNTKANTINIELNNYLPYGTKQANVIVKGDGKEIYNEILNSDVDYKAMLSYPDDAGKITIEVTAKNNGGLISDPLVKEFLTYKSGSGLVLKFPEDGVYNNFQYEFSYENASNTELTFKINDEEKKVTVDGSGSKVTTLPANDNNVVVSYKDEAGIVFIHYSVIAVDNIPPALTVYESLDGITTDKETITVTGKTDSDATLSINDKDVTVNKSGTFSYECSLEKGINVINISATDAAGNTTTYAVKINRGDVVTEVGNVVDEDSTAGKILKYIYLIVAGVVSVFAIILMIVVGRGKKKQQPKSYILKNASAVVAVFSFIATVAMGILMVVRKHYEVSEEYIKLANNFPKKAFEYLQNTKLVMIGLIICAVLFAVTVIISLVAGVIGKKKLMAIDEKYAAKENKKAEKKAEKKAKEDAEKKAKKAAEKAKKEAEKEAEKAAAKAKAEAEKKAKKEAEKAKAEAEKEAKKAEEKAEKEAKKAEEKAKKEAEEAARKAETELSRKEAEAEEAAKYKFCTGCGNKILVTAKFCGKCGAKQD